MSKIRKAARGRACQIRIPGHYCDPDTVVLCHLDGAGMGRKSHDIHGAFGCAICHDIVDGRVKTDIPRDTINRWFLEAVIRTQILLLKDGLIHA